MIGPLPYIGGKNRLATTIIKLLPEHTTYVEAFAGGAQVFFHKPPSKVEILNDLNGEVVNFFRVCQSHHEELVRYLRYMVMSRKLYRWFASQPPDTLTDIQRAGRFFYLQKNSFGGLVLKQNYHYTVTNPPNYNPNRIPEKLEETQKRLSGVQIENLPYERVLEKYDRPTTLFYLDPPYWNRFLYRFNFKEEDFVALEKRLHDVTGKFLLSLNDCPEVRDLFKAFQIRKESMAYSAQRKAGKTYGELLIANFPLDTAP
jgi:DNA adenine methylase